MTGMVHGILTVDESQIWWLIPVFVYASFFHYKAITTKRLQQMEMVYTMADLFLLWKIDKIYISNGFHYRYLIC